MDTSRWICLYPSYLDSAKTIDKGRKIAKAKAVDAPHAEEVYATVRFMGFEAVLEKKYYSKNFHYSTDLYSRGRIRVKLFDENKKPIRPEIGSRRALFVQVANNIPKYREKYGRKVDQLSQAMTAPAATASGGSSKKAGKSNKKGGKKKK
ncbi:hypothetical protein NDN08_007300 [Rhodosorus marinus]|uniref:Signal recognition particle 19 kDa protein n=1 Tax=Rhodosorus marinus TaxID=101924 RepID=A0AAV8UG72_9RHOD|nr:hypothetical protein NDN08_007300 [Rhodosorus marinus]